MGTAADQPQEQVRLGSYEILRKLARGGMAELYLARTRGPEGFEKIVVLKKILPKHAENPKFVRLFLDEAKLAATLDHPHIAHVYDMGKVEGHYFFTMEYVHGQDVRTTLRRTARLDQKFPIDHAVQIGRNIAAALHYAHERRKDDGSLLDIVHRDVSPSNILISYDGAVKLVDFGVAKAATSTVKTRTGTLKGKIAYMSPEQARGSAIDRRSDIFSLGIVLWEMVTTQRLYKGENDLATIQLIINSEVPRPSSVRPECSPELESILLRALSVDPAERYQTAEQLQLDLEELATEHKLKLSSVALRAHMHELFEDEIKAWKSAQATGVTLTDYVLSASAAQEMTTPVSDGEIEFLDDDIPDDNDDDDDDDNADSGIATGQEPAAGQVTAIMPVPMPALAAQQQQQQQPSVVVGRVDHTPIPGAIAHAASGPVRLSTNNSSSPMPPVEPHVTPFPIAPKEWRPTTETTKPQQDQLDLQKKRILIGIACAFAAIVILALAFGTDDPAVASETEAPAVVPMSATPPTPEPTAPAPAPTPVETAPPAPAPAPAVVPPEPKPAEPKPAEVKPHKPAEKKAAAAPAVCDAEALATEGKTHEAAGLHPAALDSFKASLRCKYDPVVGMLAVMAACNGKNTVDARRYYASLPAELQNRVNPICLRNAITLDPTHKPSDVKSTTIHHPTAPTPPAPLPHNSTKSKLDTNSALPPSE